MMRSVVWFTVAVLAASGVLVAPVMFLAGTAARLSRERTFSNRTRRLIRVLVSGSGVLIAAIGMTAAVKLYLLTGTQQWWWAIPICAVLLMFSVLQGIKCSRLGKRLFGPIHTEQDLPNPEGAVLLLRPFQEDRLPSLVPIAASEEEHLVHALRAAGAVLAVGDPGDLQELPPPGGARIYLSKDWKPVVEDLIARCRIVVLRVGAGTAEGFWWEVQKVASLRPISTAIFVFPPDAGELTAFRHKTSGYFPAAAIPRDMPPGWSANGGLLWFDKGGAGHLQAFSAEPGTLGFRREAVRRVVRAVLRQMGVAARV